MPRSPRSLSPELSSPRGHDAPAASVYQEKMPESEVGAGLCRARRAFVTRTGEEPPSDPLCGGAWGACPRSTGAAARACRVGWRDSVLRITQDAHLPLVSCGDTNRRIRLERQVLGPPPGDLPVQDPVFGVRVSSPGAFEAEVTEGAAPAGGRAIGHLAWTRINRRRTLRKSGAWPELQKIPPHRSSRLHPGSRTLARR